MAVAAFALASGAQAQYYNYDVTIRQPPSLSELIAINQPLTQRDILNFHNIWTYQLVNIQRAFCVRAVPGLGAAIRDGNWSAAVSFISSWTDAEAAYEKKYRQFSPAWQAAHRATWGNDQRPPLMINDSPAR